MREDITIKPVDLRGILQYVPQFWNHIFVIAINGSVADDENFLDILTDITVLHSLNIKIVLVHGIGLQLTRLAAEEKIQITDAYGEGVTDIDTLDLAIKASGKVTHQFMRGLTQLGLKCTLVNAARATEVGILRGKDQAFSGKVEKMDVDLIQTLLDQRTIPLFSPILFNRTGQPLRVNSDRLASDLAIQLKASKLIYITATDGLLVQRKKVSNITIEELCKIIKKHSKSIDQQTLSKAQHAIRTLKRGTQRVHIINGRIFGGLLTEVFDKVGVGTMIHTDEYQQIRRARKKDVQAIYTLMREAAKGDALRSCSRQVIEKAIQSFYVYEVDESVIACFRLIKMPRSKTIELASLVVQTVYQGKNIGRKMVEFACLESRSQGSKKILALSTQSFSFFQKVCGFQEGNLKDMPTSRRKDYQASGRNGRILIKMLDKPALQKRA